MTLPATDTFTTGSDQALTAYSGNWSNVQGQLWVYAASDDYTPNGDLECCARWNADTFNANQYAQCAISNNSTSGWVGVSVRASSSAADYYGFYSGSSSDGVYLFKVVGGTWTQIGSPGPAVTTSDVLRLEVSGTTLTTLVNGSSAGIGSQTDSSIASGYAGVCGYGLASIGYRADTWEGGNLGGAAPEAYGAQMLGFQLFAYVAGGDSEVVEAPSGYLTPMGIIW